MRAIVISRSGPPDTLELKEVETPCPQAGEVRVRVKATAVNRVDVLQRLGRYPAPPDAPADIPGVEFAGEVDAVGGQVRSFAGGERVFGLAAGGTCAEFVVVHERTLAPIPDRLSYIEAAAIPEAFITAYDAMALKGRLGSGETVLIHAVGSGVGTAAVQIAHRLGAFSIGTSRTAEKIAKARALGLDHGILVSGGQFKEKVLEVSGGGADLVLELVGGGYIAEDLASMATHGRLVLVGLLAGARAELDVSPILLKRLEIHGTVLRARPLEEKIMATRMFTHHLLPLLARGHLAPVIDRVLPLCEVAEAHRIVERNESFGKIVLTVDA